MRRATGGQDLSLFDTLLGDDHRATAATTRKDSEGEDSEENMTEYGLTDMDLGFDSGVATAGGKLIAEHADDMVVVSSNLGESVPIDHKAMLKELNKIQQFALEL